MANLLGVKKEEKVDFQLGAMFAGDMWGTQDENDVQTRVQVLKEGGAGHHSALDKIRNSLSDDHVTTNVEEADLLSLIE